MAVVENQIRELARLHGQPELSSYAVRDLRTALENNHVDSILDAVPVQSQMESGGTYDDKEKRR
jgi:hypothetical protein